MSDKPTFETPPLPSSSSLILTLGGLAMLSGVLIVLTYQLTLPRILQNKREALEKAVFKVLPGATSRANFHIDEEGLAPLPDDDIDGANVFAGYDTEGKLVGLAMEGSARGYQDIVKVLFGYAPDREQVIGFTVLQSTETPGLGDRINSDEDFLANFKELDARLNGDHTAVAHEIVTVKHGKKTEPWQIDGISGATISSTAVGKGLRESTNKLLPLLGQVPPASFEQPAPPTGAP